MPPTRIQSLALSEQLLCHGAKKTKEPTSKPLDEQGGTMLHGGVITFEKARAKMNSAIRPYDGKRICAGLLSRTSSGRLDFAPSCAASGLPLFLPVMSTLVECVPNFSEGRNKAVVDAIVDAMKIPGVSLLDREMDSDHNRCVITIVGDREAIAEAAIRGVGKASELIDLTKHQGAHPRIGASDVIPFIPIEGVTIEDCVAIARKVGEEIWKRFKIPVYLYESAATNPDRQNLENIRRGQFEGLKEDILVNPARCPDFGDPRCHPTAGATVVGARKALIAYNVFLNTKDVDIAKKIAKAVRYSSGGLRYVKGAGFEVRGLAQVSMNLTDFEQTPIARVFEFVKREAERYGVQPLSSEIVGLIPKKALEQAAEWFLQVENFDSSMILENRLAAVTSGKMAVGGLRAGVEPFIEQLAAPTATPGGGSAVASVAAMAAALGSMVAAMSRTKKAYAQYEPQLSAALARLAQLREELKAGIDADAESYNKVLAAYKLAKTSSDGEVAIETAMQGATTVPMDTAQRAREVKDVIETLKPITSPNMASDLTVASSLASAAIVGALANVEINLGSLKDADFADEIRSRVVELQR